VVLRNVRLSMWAPSCLPGYHLPFFAAGAAGIFAEHGLQVELVDPLPGPDNVRRVAEGRADFCLTNVNYYLAASSNVTPRLGPLPARFVMVIQQRSTLAALVRADSGLITTSDIGGCRVAGTPPHLARCSTFNMPEFFAEVRALEVAPPVFVPVADHQEAHVKLVQGDCDVIVALVDQLPVVARRVGIALRAIPLDIPIYANGIVAGDSVPTEVVVRMVEAVTAALWAQKRHPRRGVSQLRERYPSIEETDAVESWRLGAPYVFVDGGPRPMDPQRWAQTLNLATAAHGFARPLPERVYRQEPAAVGPPVVSPRIPVGAGATQS